jgi:3-dehydroquinate synthase
MAEQITVALGDRSYPIHIGEGMFVRLPELLTGAGITGSPILVTNPVVAELHGNRLLGILRAAGFNPDMILVPDGEAYKSLDTAGRLYEDLARRRAERDTPIIALGGGVIGDLAGFVAATYQRGVPFVQLPTTLLAQVDSSIGGKVAVNVGNLKNMAGAFYQPRMVVTDTSTLQTLPVAEIRNGLAEIIKCAVISDPGLFTFLEAQISAILEKDYEAVTFAVTRAAEVKARVVEKDERDQGLRNILNFGHTFGHAIECIENFKTPHGTAVAIGMASSARLANRLGLIGGDDMSRITHLITAAGLPVTYQIKRAEAFMDAMQHDKKVAAGKIKFILPTGIGSVVTRTNIDPAMALEALAP